MKILWLYKYMKNYNFDHFLHMDVAESLAKFPGVELKTYGMNITKNLFPQTCLCHWDRDITLETLYSMFQFDIIIINTKSRCFEDYLPKYAIDNTRGEIRVKEWLPRDFARFSHAKKIVIEEDYHYEDGDSWYKERDISLILQRHYRNVDFGNSFNSGIKHIFFPFSVDINLFRNYNTPRRKIITYTGSINEKYYIDRHTVVSMLKAKGLITDTSPNRVENNRYIEDLNSFVSHLSGQSTYHILPAKIYEIVVCGSILFTNNNPKSGIDLVLPNCYVSYKDDYSDVITQAWKIINGEYNNQIDKNIEFVKKYHSHEVRHQQLLDIINGKRSSSDKYI